MIDFSEIEPYYGPLAVEDLDAAAAAALNPETEAVDIYDSDAVEGNSTLVSVECMAATMKAANQIIVFPTGKTLSITFTGGAKIGGLLVTIYGPQNANNTQSSMYIVNHYGSGTSTIKPVLSSTHITTSVSGEVFSFTNTGSYGVRACVMVLGLEPGLTFSCEVT